MDHIRSRPLQASPCLQSAPFPISQRTFIAGEGKGGTWHSQILGYTHLAWLSSLRAASQPLQKGATVALAPIFARMRQNQAAPLGVKLLTLTKCSSQPRAARPRGCSAPPPDTDNLQPDGSDRRIPVACGSDFFWGGFSSHRASGRFQCAVIQAPRQHVESRFALTKLPDHSHSLCISTVRRCVCPLD